MKKRLLLVMVGALSVSLFLSLNSCDQSKKSEKTETGSVPIKAPLDTSREAFMIGPLTPPSAPIKDLEIKNAVYDFMKDTELFDLALWGQGGVFSADLFKINQGNVGICLWFCFDPASRKFFVALEQLKDYDRKNLPMYVTQDSLTVPYIFNYLKKKDTDPTKLRKNVEDHLDKDTQKPTDDPDFQMVKIDSASANFYIKQFRKRQSKYGYCEYSFSCFGEDEFPYTPPATSKKYLKNFVDAIQKDNGYVKYYFSYMEKVDAVETTNKIRVILVGVDKNGNRKDYTKDGGGGLESSWPPPPPPSGKK